MKSPTDTLKVRHRQQLHEADCLAACAAMLLDLIWRPTSYERLLALLDVGSFGAPRRNVVRLTRLGVDVIYREASLPILIEMLRAGTPVIAFVDTGELHYWKTTTNHAVLVIGEQGEFLVVNDPALPVGAQQIPKDEFELAWLNSDYACAMIMTR